MKYRWDKKYLYWGMTAFLVLCASIFFYYLLFHGGSLKIGAFKLASISMPVIDGLILAYLLTPVLNFIEKKILLPLFKMSKKELNSKGVRRVRVYAIIITVIIVFFVVYGFFSAVIPQLILSIQNIINHFPVYVNNLIRLTNSLLKNNPTIEKTATSYLNAYSGEMQNWLNKSVMPRMNQVFMILTSSIWGFFVALWNFIIGFIISIYILGSKELFAGQAKKLIYAIFETKTANAIIKDVRFIHRTFSGFIGGKIFDSIIIGILCFIGTSLIGTPYPVLISVIVGVTNVIPFFGPYFGAIPSAMLILMVDPLQCLYFIFFIFFLQQLDGNLIGPKILGDSTGLSSFWVIFAITLFGGLFGVPGMIIGVPTFAVIYAGTRAISNKMLKKKKLPTDTQEYLKVDYIQDLTLIESVSIKKSRDKNRKEENKNKEE